MAINKHLVWHNLFQPPSACTSAHFRGDHFRSLGHGYRMARAKNRNFRINTQIRQFDRRRDPFGRNSWWLPVPLRRIRRGPLESSPVKAFSGRPSRICYSIGPNLWTSRLHLLIERILGIRACWRMDHNLGSEGARTHILYGQYPRLLDFRLLKSGLKNPLLLDLELLGCQRRALLVSILLWNVNRLLSWKRWTDRIWNLHTFSFWHDS